MKAYKLTDAAGYTRRNLSSETLWTVGETVRPKGEGTKPCGPGVLHLYASPEEAMLYDPIHGDYGKAARLFEVRADGRSVKSDGLKLWTTRPVKVLRELPLPEITIEERVAWAICIAPHPSTREWAIGWLSGRDRSEAAWAARAARADAWAAAEAAAEARAAAARAAKPEAFHSRSLAMLARARAILAGEFPAERYDEPLEGRGAGA